jgi:hypothetical protein
MASLPTARPDAGDAILIRTPDGSPPCVSSASLDCPQILSGADQDAVARAERLLRAQAVDLRGMLCRIRGEFLEMPGLCLTEPQAQRLWSLDCRTCRALLTALVEAKLLARTADGRVKRSDGAI